MRVRIVLVEPKEAGNIGAAARAMKNFGLSDLAIVGRYPPLHPIADWWASGADDIVASAALHPTLHAAIADCSVTVATTSSRGRIAPVDFDPEGTAAFAGTLAERERMAIVFGREDHGLTSEEISICSHLATIPSSPSFPTLNLAQSVSLFAYALSRCSDATAPLPRQRAAAALVERLHERLQALFLEAGFLHLENPDRIYLEVRRWVTRLDLDEREAEVAMAIVRQLEWRVREK